jgi:hypothetical protein
LVSHAELRRRWRSWLAIVILIGVVAGFVLAATAGGRRTESAFPRFVAAHGFDAVVYVPRHVPKVAKLPGVSSVTEVVIPDTAVVPTLLIGELAAGVIVVAIAIAPALAATRSKPGDLLRTPQLSAS